MLTGSPLFGGHDHFDQIRMILSLVGGFPSDQRLMYRYEQVGLALGEVDFFPGGLREHLSISGADDDAIDLIETLLSLNPDDRGDARTALTHPYFHDLIESPTLSPTLSPQPPLEFDSGFAVEALTRAPHSVAEGEYPVLVTSNHGLFN